MAVGHAPWNDIGPYPAHADDHRALPDPHELPHRDHSAKIDVVAYRYVAAENDIVREGHVVADLAVVPDMRTHHDQALVADLGDAAIILRAGVHRDVLADIASRADHKPRRTAAILVRLRRGSKRRKRSNDRPRPDPSNARDIDVR